MGKPFIYIVAGEASADALGSGIMRALRGYRDDCAFAGIGGETMAQEGLQSLFPYQELSLMGFLEVVPYIPAILRRLRETLEDIAKKQPNIVLTIDSPGFNFRLANALKKDPRTSAIKRIHYVAPSVWAYKPKRARKTAQLFDGLLTLLPFEPPYFEREGLNTIFTGHPVLWNHHKGVASHFRLRHNIFQQTPILLLLPGSRAGEIKHHLALFVEAAHTLPSYTPVILASPQVKERIFGAIPPHVMVADIKEKQDAFAAADLALSKSGTITLELAAANVPTVVAHKVNPISAWLAQRMIRIPYVSLINIAVNKEIMPELLQANCTLPRITKALAQLADPSAAQKQQEQYSSAIAVLKGTAIQSPDNIAAQAVLGYL